MKPTSISLDPKIAEAGKRKADSEGRSFSSYVARLIARDLGLQTDPVDEDRLASVTNSLRRDPAALGAVERVLAQRSRHRRTARKAA